MDDIDFPSSPYSVIGKEGTPLQPGPGPGSGKMAESDPRWGQAGPGQLSSWLRDLTGGSYKHVVTSHYEIWTRVQIIR